MDKQMKILLRPRDEIVAMHPLPGTSAYQRFLIITRQGYFYEGGYGSVTGKFTVKQIAAPVPE